MAKRKIKEEVIERAKDKNVLALSQATCAFDIAIIAITAALYAP